MRKLFLYILLLISILVLGGCITTSGPESGSQHDYWQDRLQWELNNADYT